MSVNFPCNIVHEYCEYAKKVSWPAALSDEGCIPLVLSPGSASAQLNVMTISRLKYKTKFNCRQETLFALLDLGPLLSVSRESETEVQERISL